jgi:pimeloyl-ACP methyl ester carboxylesterase
VACACLVAPGCRRCHAQPSRWTRSWPQIDAVVAHDATAELSEINAPTLLTFGARDLVCSKRFHEPLKDGIAGSELVVFEHLSHAGLHEDPETFNRVTLDFLLRQPA